MQVGGIRVRTLVCPRTGKGDKFMTPFVYHETANCKKREASWCYRQSWYTYTFKKKKISFIFIFSSLLDKRPLFEIYFWPCSINSRYMLQLPILRHCFSSFNSHDLLLVLDIAQALAHLWANIDGFTFFYQTSEYQQISTSLSIPEVHCRNGLWWIMLASKAPKITNFKVHNHFFKTVLPFLSFSLIL